MAAGPPYCHVEPRAPDSTRQFTFGVVTNEQSSQPEEVGLGYKLHVR